MLTRKKAEPITDEVWTRLAPANLKFPGVGD